MVCLRSVQFRTIDADMHHERLSLVFILFTVLAPHSGHALLTDMVRATSAIYTMVDMSFAQAELPRRFDKKISVELAFFAFDTKVCM